MAVNSTVVAVVAKADDAVVVVSAPAVAFGTPPRQPRNLIGSGGLSHVRKIEVIVDLAQAIFGSFLIKNRSSRNRDFSSARRFENMAKSLTTSLMSSVTCTRYPSPIF